MINYRPRPGSVADKVLTALAALPLGTKLRTSELAILASVSKTNFANSLEAAVDHSMIRMRHVHRRKVVWYLPYPDEDAEPIVEAEADEQVGTVTEDPPVEEETETDFPPRRTGLYKPGGFNTGQNDRELQRRFADQQATNLTFLFREMLTTAKYVKTGDPLRGLVEFNDVAREVHDAKERSQFKGAEVDLLIAREYKNISIAIIRATENLKEALEMMNCLSVSQG